MSYPKLDISNIKNGHKFTHNDEVYTIIGEPTYIIESVAAAFYFTAETTINNSTKQYSFSINTQGDVTKKEKKTGGSRRKSRKTKRSRKTKNKKAKRRTKRRTKN